jgi:hypothetical protein
MNLTVVLLVTLMIILLAILTWMVLSRLIYVSYVTHVEDRKLQANKGRELSWDALHMFPIVGDVNLVIWLSFYMASLVSKWTHDRKVGKIKKVKALEKKISALEKRIKEQQPPSLENANQEMLKAVAEVEKLTRSRQAASKQAA